jgi:hypothetical protein
MRRTLLPVILLTSALASAQTTVVRAPPPPPPEPANGLLVELKMGTLIPRIADEPGLSGDPYGEVFHNSSMIYGGGEIDYLAWRGYGALGVGFSIGYTEKYAPATVVSTNQPSTEKTALILFPLRLSVLYRWDVTWTRWGVPLVPYFKLALLSTPWRVTKGGDTEIFIDNAGNRLEGKGLKWGYGFTVGVAFVLDVLSERMAKDLTNDTGIRHSYIFAEFNDDHSDDFGKVGLNLSARYFTFGLGFEF